MNEIRRGKVYDVELKNTSSHVQFGRRPCLVVQTFSPTIIVVPLTTKLKKTHLPVHVITAKNQMALCECVLTISKEQIISYIKTLDEKTMKLIDRALSISLELEKEGTVLKK